MRGTLSSLHLFFEVLVIVPIGFVDISSSDYTSCSPISQEVNDKTIWWGNTAEDDREWYTSEPLCLGDNYTIMKRKCQNDSWSPEPLCVNLQDKFSPCPDNFTYHEEKEICYMVMINQTFPPSCPYKNVISFYEYSFLIGNEIDGPVWFPARRAYDVGLGHMFITEPTRYYGSLVTMAYTWRDSFNKDCLVSHSSLSYEIVHCNSTYDAVCAYKSLGHLENTYCSRYVDEECYYSDYNLTESKCFCMKNNTQQCSALAELKKPYQNFILPLNHSECRIGLELEDGFLWVNSKEKISYSNWNKKTDFKNRYGVLTGQASWSLESEDASNCTLCQESTTYDEPKMSLVMDSKNKQLVLTVDNPKDLYIPENSNSYLFCFTDAITASHTKQFYPYDYFENVNDARTVYYFSYSSNYPGYYWCEAFTYPNITAIKTGRILVFDEDLYGNEFVTTLVVAYDVSANPTSSTFYITLHDAMQNNLNQQDLVVPFSLRLVAITRVDETARTAEYLIHVTSKSFTSVETEYEEFKNQIAAAVNNVSSILGMTEFKSASYCLPSTTISNGINLRWPLTKINTTVTPEEFCLHEDGSPVTRTCLGNFLTGGQWSEVDGYCADNPFQSSLTASLYELLQSNASLSDKSDYLAEMTKDVSEYIPVDIHYIAEIFEKSDKEDFSSIENVTVVLDNILNVQKNTLSESQAILNSTDKLLYNFDLLLQSFTRQTNARSTKVSEVITKNLMVFMFDAKQTDITGIALYNRSSEMEVVKLRGNESYVDLLDNEDLEVAAYIPESLLHQIGESLDSTEQLFVVITIFLNDYLFNEDPKTTSGDPYKTVFGILLPPIDEAYKSSVKLVYNFSTSDNEENCAYWHYGTVNDYKNIKGQWEAQRNPLVDGATRVCNFEHTTHFALLILADVSLDEQESYEKHYTILHVITSIGCSFSIFGLFCIFLTALLFRRWRQNKGNQILLQYSIVTLLQIILLYTSNVIRTSGHVDVLCILIGALLHYIVLAQFCWTLVMAVLHYQRFVLVFAKPRRWVLLKSCLFAYGLPLLPVIVNMCVSPSNYVLGNTGMCYPTDDGFTIWLLTPVILISAINLILFCIIIWNIFNEKVDDMYGHDYILVLKLRLVTVLFSLLGLTWIFGFAAEFLSSVLFAYLFTIAGSLQGFVMFLAFIILNETTRNMYWVFIMKTCKYREY